MIPTVTLTRSLLTVVVPGIVATSPWLLALVQYTDATLGFDKNVGLGSGLVFALVVVIGSFCEGAGTYVEHAWDSRLEAELEVEEHWQRYLNYAGEKEPVVFRYLSRLVTTLYYELSMMFAVLFSWPGVTVLSALRFSSYACLIAVLGTLLTIGAVLYFFIQARNTHRGMCTLRKKMELPP